MCLNSCFYWLSSQLLQHFSHTDCLTGYLSQTQGHFIVVLSCKNQWQPQLLTTLIFNFPLICPPCSELYNSPLSPLLRTLSLVHVHASQFISLCSRLMDSLCNQLYSAKSPMWICTIHTVTIVPLSK